VDPRFREDDNKLSAGLEGQRFIYMSAFRLVNFTRRAKTKTKSWLLIKEKEKVIGARDKYSY